MTVKKVVAMLLCFAMLFSMAACGETKPAANNNAGGNETPAVQPTISRPSLSD